MQEIWEWNNEKNEKGFALVLSLVLMLAMSLMGGALIVISAGDHQSNNRSDEYQQTFYVAETALIEGEKYVLNQFLDLGILQIIKEIHQKEIYQQIKHLNGRKYELKKL